MKHMCAQTRPHLKEFWGNGVRTRVNSMGKIPSTRKILLRGGSNPQCCIKQDSKPNTLPTELFRPPDESTLSEEDEGSPPALSDSTIDTLPDAWCYRVSAGTGLARGESTVTSLTCNFSHSVLLLHSM